jgi:MFS family permease
MAIDATQNVQWLILMGTSFTVAAFLQTVRGYDAIRTGVIFTAATVGVLVSSLAAERLARRYAQRTLILAGFVVTIAGIGLLLGFVRPLAQHLHLGSSFGTAIAGTILVSDLASGTRSYGFAMIALAIFGLVGLGAALLLPGNPEPRGTPRTAAVNEFLDGQKASAA